jgi:hypothetical protein
VSQKGIDPQVVTKPIQLLAAWLAGLVLVDGLFLGAAASLDTPTWAPAALTIAAIVNVPVFIGALFVLQTRYRPQMQEDQYYSRYLEAQDRRITVEDVSADVSVVRRDMAELNRTTLDVVADLRRHLATIALGLESRQSPSSDALDIGLEATAGTIRRAQVAARWDGYRVSVNTLLPTFAETVQVLTRIGIDSFDRFGRNRLAVGLISFGTDVAAADLLVLCRELRDLGIDFIGHGDEDMHRGRLYIGSYGYEHTTVARLDDELLDALEDRADDEFYEDLVVERSTVHIPPPSDGWSSHGRSR